MDQDRRNDYDVTNTVMVSDPTSVRNEVRRLFAETYPKFSFDHLWLAFHDFERLYRGKLPGYLGCDTTYHDIQHVLDMTLAMARLIAGYEKCRDEESQLGAERAQIGLITSLFHDSGYIRHEERDKGFRNGAEFTAQHVTRGANFLRDYLPSIGLEKGVGVASIIIHFTGYEVAFDDIQLDDPRDVFVGHLLGTADLMAQMADRCYLEKCRDHLYKEFVVGGVAIKNGAPGSTIVNYTSGEDLLRKTPMFYEGSAKHRLNENFGRAYRYIEVLYDGENPYIDAITQNLRHLQQVLKSDDWSQLRRSPESIYSEEDTMTTLEALVEEQVAALEDDEIGDADDDLHRAAQTGS